MHHQTRTLLQFSYVSCVLYNLKFKGTAISKISKIHHIQITFTSSCEERRLNLFKTRGTQREYSSKPLKHSIVERILVFKQ